MSHNITSFSCDVQGTLVIKNNADKENKFLIRYELKTKLAKKVIKTEKIEILANDNKIINIYNLADVKKEDVLKLELSIEEYDFLIQIQTYIVILIFINSIFLMMLCYHIKLVERELNEKFSSLFFVTKMLQLIKLY